MRSIPRPPASAVAALAQTFELRFGGINFALQGGPLLAGLAPVFDGRRPAAQSIPPSVLPFPARVSMPAACFRSDCERARGLETSRRPRWKWQNRRRYRLSRRSASGRIRAPTGPGAARLAEQINSSEADVQRLSQSRTPLAGGRGIDRMASTHRLASIRVLGPLSGRLREISTKASRVHRGSVSETRNRSAHGAGDAPSAYRPPRSRAHRGPSSRRAVRDAGLLVQGVH